MILWSILSREAWAELRKKGRLRANQRHITQYRLCSYLWMIEQMENRLKSPCWGKNAFPLWAWYQCEDIKRRMPDLRTSGFFEKGIPGVRLECDVPEDRVLLSDFELWHYVLNYWYLPDSLKDGDRFNAMLKKDHLSKTRFSLENPLPPNYHKMVAKSWERIFDLAWMDRYRKIAQPFEEKSIQATIWELNLEEIIGVTEFIAR